MEDSFDKSIAADEVVYSKYLTVFMEVLNKCDSTMFLTTTDRIVSDLTALSNDKKSCEVTKFLDRDSFDLESAKLEIKKSTDFLIIRRNSFIDTLGQ